jgi:cobalamin biosynthesis protein CobT
LGDPYHALKTVCNSIEREKRVELYGIGMLDDNVRRFYTKNTVIDDAAGIEQGLMSVLKQALT